MNKFNLLIVGILSLWAGPAFAQNKDASDDSSASRVVLESSIGGGLVGVGGGGLVRSDMRVGQASVNELQQADLDLRAQEARAALEELKKDLGTRKPQALLLPEARQKLEEAQALREKIGSQQMYSGITIKNRISALEDEIASLEKNPLANLGRATRLQKDLREAQQLADETQSAADAFRTATPIFAKESAALQGMRIVSVAGGVVFIADAANKIAAWNKASKTVRLLETNSPEYLNAKMHLDPKVIDEPLAQSDPAGGH